MNFFDAITLWISLKTAACATLLASAVGLSAAAYMSRKEKVWSARRFALVDTLLIAPMILPPTVLGFALLLLFGINSPLGQLWEFVWGDPLVFSWPGAVVAATTVAFPLMYRTTRAAFLQVDPHIIAAARTLTNSEWRIYRLVILPAAWPGVVAGTLLAFARSLGEFGATLMLAGSIPGRTRTMPMTIYYAVESGQYEEAAFWSILILIISLLVIFFAESRLKPTAFVSKPVFQPAPDDALTGPLALHIRKALYSFPLDLQLTTSSRRVAVLGASGSGKSLFLRCLAGLEQPDQGYIRVDDRWYFHSGRALSLPPRQRQVGLLLQNYALFPQLSVRDNIAFGMQTPNPAKVNAWIQKLGLETLGNQKPAQLSGGQQQRVALARALAAEPELLLLDEPFTALDAHLRDRLEQELIADLYHFPGRLFLVTHNVEEAWRLAEEIIILEAGHIIRQGPKADVFADPRTVSAAQLTGCKNLAKIAQQTGSRAKVEAWNCELDLPEGRTEGDWLGIRAHHIQITLNKSGTFNTFPCWLARVSESPHRLTFFLKLQSPPADAFDAPIQVAMSREKAAEFQSFPQPWFVTFPRDRLLILQEKNP